MIPQKSLNAALKTQTVMKNTKSITTNKGVEK